MDIKEKYPEKFAAESAIFNRIRRGDKIFIGTGCAEPQYLLRALLKYIEEHPKAFYGAELFQVWSLGITPNVDEKFGLYFRRNFFFVGEKMREAVNTGLADYTPIFSSKVPELLANKIIKLNAALIQTSPPDQRGYVSLGISLDITMAAVQNAPLVIAQVNSHMPRVHGDTFIHLDNIDFIIPYDEPLPEYAQEADTEISRGIGKYVARLIQDGDTIQVGVGRIINSVLKQLSGKKHLGVHTELLNDGIVDLMKIGVIDNSKKSIHRGKTVATFCMGSTETYQYIHDNPAIEFRTVDYTNNPMIIAQNDNMTAINNAIEIDLTGQATTESIGKYFYRGIGGQADFMRGALMAKNGKTILAMRSTDNEEKESRIVPFLKEGAGVTLNRGDIHYVVTEYGIAYLHGKNIRERAMELISIAHPKFRAGLIEEAKAYHLIYPDQKFVTGKKGEYPEALETQITTKTGLTLLLRPVKMADEPLLKDFFYSLSDRSLFYRFFHNPQRIPHEFLQEFVVIDYTKLMVILATIRQGKKEKAVGIAQYFINENDHTAEVAFAVRDDYQNQGIGKQLILYLTHLAQKKGLLGFTASVLSDNHSMLHLFQNMDFQIAIEYDQGTCELKMMFQ